MKRLTWKHYIGILLSVGMISTIVLVLLQVRQQVQSHEQDPRVQQDWLDWVETAEKQAAGEGPVQRRVPQSEAPPLTMLMGRHFFVCLVASCVLATALYVTLVFLILGSYNTNVATPDKPTEEADHE